MSIYDALGLYSHTNPNAGSIERSGVTRFLLRDVTVLPQIAKLCPENRQNAHAMKLSDIQVVLPLRTAPSQIMASQFL